MFTELNRFGRLFLVLICLAVASSAVCAQDIPNYLFLEVLDSSKKPVRDALVEMTPPPVRKNRYTFGPQSKTTNQSGTVGVILPKYPFEISQSLFKITKSGFFDFFDFGLQVRRRDQIEVRIEMLKIPETPAEQKALGNEQIKRELLWAAKDGNAPAVRRLLKKGLDPNLKTGDLRGIVMPQNLAGVLLAAGAGDGNTVRAFLDAGAKVNVKEEPLRSIVATYLTVNPATSREFANSKERAKAVDEYLRGLKRLIKAGAPSNDLQRLKGLTALMIAARENDAESVGFLLKLGASVNENIGGYTALITAVDQYSNNRAGYSTRNVVEVLLKAGADPNIAVISDGDNCRSPLMQAVYGGDVETVRLLLAYNADVNFTCKNGMNAIKWAKRYAHSGEENQKKIIALLEANGAK